MTTASGPCRWQRTRIGLHAPDFVLGVGGGRVVDVAKLAAARRARRS